MLRANLELLYDPDFEPLIASLITDEIDSAELLKLKSFHALLATLKRTGIDGLLQDLQRQVDLFERSFGLLTSARSFEELIALLRDHSDELLSDTTMAALRSMTRLPPGYLAEQTASSVRFHLALFERARARGVEFAIEWERQDRLLRSLMTPGATLSTIIADNLDAFASESMGEVLDELLRGVQPAERAQRWSAGIRGEICEALWRASKTRGLLRPSWLIPPQDLQKAEALIARRVSVEEMDAAIKSAPALYVAIGEALRTHEVRSSISEAPAGSEPSLIARVLAQRPDDVDNEALFDSLLHDFHQLRSSPARPQREFEHWLIMAEPWLRDLPAFAGYREASANLRADPRSIALEVHRLDQKLKDNPPVNALARSNLHRQLAFLYLLLPTGDQPANYGHALHHCQAAAGCLSKREHAVSWASANGLYGEILLAQLVESSLSPVERKLSQIEPSSTKRIERLFRDFKTREDAAERAIGRFELALQIHRSDSSLECYTAGLSGLATAIALRQRGDPARNETESLRYFRQVLDIPPAKIPGVAYITHARLAYCGVYLGIPAAASRHLFTTAVRYWAASGFDLRATQALEYWAMRSFRAGDWNEALIAVTQSLSHPDRLAKPTGPTPVSSRDSVLWSMASYCLLRDGRPNEALQALELSRTSAGQAPEEPSALLRCIPEGVFVVAPLITEMGSAAFILDSRLTRLDMSNVVMINDFTDTVLSGLLISHTESGKRENGWLHALAQWRELPTAQDRLADLCTTWQRVLVAVSHMFMTPILAAVPRDGRPLVIIPHRGLAALPLHAATDFNQPQHRPIIETFDVAYAPSVRSLATARLDGRTAAEKDPSLLVVCPPVTPEPRLAAREVTNVAEMFSQSRALTESSDATRAQVMASLGCYDYVHIASHGSANWQDALDSGVEMADGLLTVRHLAASASLDRIQLMVLSACESGVIDIRQLPNSNYGMHTALHACGIKRVLSTQWPVSDAASFLLVCKFYELHRKDRLSVVSSLAEAQRWLRDLTRVEAAERLGFEPITVSAQPDRPFSDPYYWASFSLTGL